MIDSATLHVATIQIALTPASSREYVSIIISVSSAVSLCMFVVSSFYSSFLVCATFYNLALPPLLVMDYWLARFDVRAGVLEHSP